MKARRVILATGIVICVATIIALETKSSASREYSKTHQDSPQLIADGLNQPEVIPDWVAYDFLLHSIAPPTTATNRDREISDSLIKETGLGDIKTYILKRLADDTNKQISLLDQQAAAIKDQYWPRPTAEVMQQLADLQRQKEEIITKLIADLPARIGDDGVQQLNIHIRNKVKSRIKAFKDLPIEVYQRH